MSMSENGNNNHENGTSGGQGSTNKQHRLTAKMLAFVDAWFSNGFNATKAAEEAGYGGDYRTLNAIGAENLAKPSIQAEIARRWKGHGVMGEEVLSRLADWMRFDPACLFDEYGRPKYDQIRRYSRFIKRFEYKAGEGFKIELHDPMRAAELIGKFLVIDKTRAAETDDVVVVIDL